MTACKETFSEIMIQNTSSDFSLRKLVQGRVELKVRDMCKDHSVHVSGKLPSYPSPKPTLTPTAHLKQNVGLGEGYVGCFPET